MSMSILCNFLSQLLRLFVLRKLYPFKVTATMADRQVVVLARDNSHTQGSVPNLPACPTSWTQDQASPSKRNSRLGEISGALPLWKLLQCCSLPLWAGEIGAVQKLAMIKSITFPRNFSSLTLLISDVREADSSAKPASEPPSNRSESVPYSIFGPRHAFLYQAHFPPAWGTYLLLKVSEGFRPFCVGNPPGELVTSHLSIAILPPAAVDLRRQR